MGMKPKRIKDYVEECLNENIQSRNSDLVLYVSVCEKMGIKILSVSLYDLAVRPSSFPAFETVSRARRYFQARGMYLADVEVQKKRSENEFEHIKEFVYESKN